MNARSLRAAALGLTCLVGAAGAGDFTWGAGCEAGMNRMERGLVESRGPYIRPAAHLSAWAFTLTGWGAFNLAPSALDEAGLSLGAEIVIERLRLEPEVNFIVPAGASEHPEFGLSLGVSYPLLGPVSGSVAEAVDDLSSPNANSMDIGLKTEGLTLGPVVLDCGASVGWSTAEYDSAEYGVSRQAFDLAEVNAAGEYRPWKYLAIRPSLTFATILGPRLRNGLSGRQGPTNVSAALVFEIGQPKAPAEDIED